VRCNSWSNSHKATQNLTGKMKMKRRKIKIGDIVTHSKCQIHIGEIGQHSH
jgi:translation initiation factor IF-1